MDRIKLNSKALNFGILSHRKLRTMHQQEHSEEKKHNYTSRFFLIENSLKNNY